MPFRANEHFEEYRIERLLGEGGFGRVYLAEDTLLRRAVAIKELSRAASGDPVAVKRFMQEARAAAGLVHPHIVTVHALKIVTPAVYMIMEYLPRGSLREHLERSRQLSLLETVTFGAMVAEGLAAAHERGIVHRDIKPENILLTDDLRAKIADFGIAHVQRDSSGGGSLAAPDASGERQGASPQLTAPGSQPGTLLYMSPEQVCGEVVDGASDVYQLGALLYELLTGKHYLDPDSLAERARKLTATDQTQREARLYDLIANHICGDPVPDVRQHRKDVLPALAEIVWATLQKAAGGRPTAAQVATRLAEAIGALGGSTRPSRALIAPSVPAEQPEDHLGRGLALLDQDRLEEALPPLRAALAADPDSVEARRGLSWILGVQGRLGEATDEYQKLVGLVPDDANAHYNLGLAYAKQGDLDRAVEQFRVAVALNPDDPRSNYDLGVALADQEQPDEAIRALAKAAELDPRFVDAHHLLGILYAEQDETDLAIAALEKASRLDFGRLAIHHALGWQYLQKFDKAREAAYEYQTVLRASPEDPYAHGCLGMAYKRMGHKEQAIEEFWTAIRLNPADGLAHFELGQLLDETGKPEEAIAAFEAALRISPDNMLTFMLLAQTYRKLGRNEEAVSAYKSALVIKPDHFYAFKCLGEIYLAEGKLEMAATAFEASLAIAPDEAPAKRGLARTRMAQQENETAVRLYQELAAKEPDDMGVHFELAATYEQMGLLEEAVREFKEAARLDPSYRKVRRRLHAAKAALASQRRKGPAAAQETNV